MNNGTKLAVTNVLPEHCIALQKIIDQRGNTPIALTPEELKKLGIAGDLSKPLSVKDRATLISLQREFFGSLSYFYIKQDTGILFDDQGLAAIRDTKALFEKSLHVHALAALWGDRSSIDRIKLLTIIPDVRDIIGRWDEAPLSRPVAVNIGCMKRDLATEEKRLLKGMQGDVYSGAITQTEANTFRYLYMGGFGLIQHYHQGIAVLDRLDAERVHPNSCIDPGCPLIPDEKTSIPKVNRGKLRLANAGKIGVYYTKAARDVLEMLMVVSTIEAVEKFLNIEFTRQFRTTLLTRATTLEQLLNTREWCGISKLLEHIPQSAIEQYPTEVSQLLSNNTKASDHRSVVLTFLKGKGLLASEEQTPIADDKISVKERDTSPIDLIESILNEHFGKGAYQSHREVARTLHKAVKKGLLSFGDLATGLEEGLTPLEIIEEGREERRRELRVDGPTKEEAPEPESDYSEVALSPQQHLTKPRKVLYGRIEGVTSYKEWIESIPPAHRSVVEEKIQRLIAGDTCSIRTIRCSNGIQELRIFSKPAYRVLFSRANDTITLLTGFNKSDQRRILSSL